MSLLQCECPLLAQSGHTEMSAICPLSGAKADINRDCLTIVIHSAVRIEPRSRNTAAMNIVRSADNLFPRLTVFAQMP